MGSVIPLKKEIDNSYIELKNLVGNRLEDVKPIYKDFDGWLTEIKNVETFSELPKQAKDYINFISKVMDVPITIISIGPKRHQIIINN